MTEEALKAIRARADAASHAPWRVEVEALRPRVNCETVDDADGFTVCRFERRDPPDPDAAFIAAARTDVPALLDEVERLRAALLKVDEIACRSVSAAGFGDQPPEPANRDGEELAHVAREALR